MWSSSGQTVSPFAKESINQTNSSTVTGDQTGLVDYPKQLACLPCASDPGSGENLGRICEAPSKIIRINYEMQ